MSEAPTSGGAVLYDVREQVATITLNRPDRRNALDTAMCEGLLAAARAAARDADVRLVLVRGAGPAFCAGADRDERRRMDAGAVRVRRLQAFAAYEALERLPMPSIAVVHGPAIGSGCEIAAACDLVVATPAARFATPEALLGTVGATQRLPRLLGKRLAKDLMFTGRSLGAEEARAAGLVTRVVRDEDLETVLGEMARAIRGAQPRVLAAAKRCIDAGVELDPRGALGTELLAIEESLGDAAWPRGLGPGEEE